MRHGGMSVSLGFARVVLGLKPIHQGDFARFACWQLLDLELTNVAI